MTISQTRARHRAARRPISQIISNATGDNLATVSRRSAAVAATSGIVVSMLAMPATAVTDNSAASLGTADASSLTAEARAEMSAAPAIKVADADWSLTVKPVKVTPAPVVVPPPPPAPEPVAASRSVEREAAPAAEAPAAAPAAPAAETPAPVQEEKKAAAPAAGASGSAVLDIASRYVGVPYVYGGGTPSGFDCSGFTAYVYGQVGISLPRSSGAQRNAGTVIPRSEAKAGDLIWSPGHVAIYAGGNQQIDAPRPGKTIQYRGIWQSNPTFIRLG